MRIDFDADILAWDKQGGLIPAIVQHADDLQVLMLGYVSRESLQETLRLGEVVFFSRSKQRLWRKGERSGHVLRVIGIQTDCDADTLLISARPAGPTCHLGRDSCFPKAPADFASRLDALIAQRQRERPEGSYTSKLFEAGTRRIAQKVGEEGVETALAAVAQDAEALLGEAADLVFHLQVLLCDRGLGWAQVEQVLQQRHHAR